MRWMSKSMKVLSVAALGLALLAPQSQADQPKGSSPPAPVKTVVPKTTKDAGKTVKDVKKVTKGTKDRKKAAKGINKKKAKGTRKTTKDTKKVVQTAKNKAKDRSIDNRIVPPGIRR